MADQITIHRKHPISCDDSASTICQNSQFNKIITVLTLCFGQLPLQIFHIQMPISHPFGLTQSDAINYAGMIQLITEDGIPFAGNHFKKAGICIETCRIKNCIRPPMESSNRLFQPAMNVLWGILKYFGMGKIIYFWQLWRNDFSTFTIIKRIHFNFEKKLKMVLRWWMLWGMDVDPAGLLLGQLISKDNNLFQQKNIEIIIRS